VVSKLNATIDDKVIEAKIKEKEEAKQQYNDAMASGNTAVFAERDSTKKDESITLLLGNLLPGQKAQIDIQMMKPLTIEAGAFEFAIPVSFMPQYKSHELFQDFHQPNEWYLNES
jgi:Ca-activated chloride channel homolog